MRPTAGNAALRPAQNDSRSASLLLMRIEPAVLAPAIDSTFSLRSSTSGSAPAGSIIRRHSATRLVVCGETVVEAARAVRILGDTAADRAGDLARWVARVIESGAGDRVRDAAIGDAGLRHDNAVVVVDVEDAVELGHAEED